MFTSKVARSALVAVGMAATALTFAPTSADASPRYYHHNGGGYGHSYGHRGGGGGGAFVGGLVLGGVLGATVARPYYYNTYPRAYYNDDCRRVWRYDRWGNRYRTTVCY